MSVLTFSPYPYYSMYPKQQPSSIIQRIDPRTGEGIETKLDPNAMHMAYGIVLCVCVCVCVLT